jgi:anti-sigma B factor antagonist
MADLTWKDDPLIMNLRIIEDTDDLLLLELAGSLDLEGVREIETAFLAHVTFAKRPVILDFSQVTFLASFGMRMLFEAIRALGRQGQRLAILKPQAMVAQVLELGGVSSAAVISFDGADARSKLH